jgi:hypothetical protein
MQTREELEKQLKDIILYHYGWDMWASRSQFTYEEGIKPFVDSIVELFEQPTNDNKLKDYKQGELMGNIHSDLNVVIGGNIRRLRIQKSISLTRMAKMIDIDADYYADVERGAAWMRTIDLRDALLVLGVKSSAVLPF